MSRTTPLHQEHLELGAQMVEFAGWEMPIRYGSLMDEHHAVRRNAGMFDVSHMAVVDLHGERCQEFLRYLLANDIAKLKQTGRAMYTCMLNPQAGIIDDLIVYYFSDDWYRMVVNAGTRDGDIAWIKQHAGDFGISVTERSDLAILAVQGPQALTQLNAVLSRTAAAAVQELKPFQAWHEDSWAIARTGYTGEDGCEVIVAAEDVVPLWRALIKQGVTPCGLGARDTLRLEAGMNLYGQDMDTSTNPLECALGWTIAWDPADRDFIGRQALSDIRAAGTQQKLVGLILDQRAVLRSGQEVYDADGNVVGKITSGTFSPTVQRPIGFARILKTVTDACQVNIRGKMLPARIVKAPFVRQGKVMPGILETE